MIEGTCILVGRYQAAAKDETLQIVASIVILMKFGQRGKMSAG